MNFIPLFSVSILPVGQIKKALFRAIDKYEEANGITDKDLAERIRCDPSLICKYRNGPTRIADLQIEKICSALGLRWQDLDVDTGVKRRDEVEKIRMKLDQLTDLTDEELQASWRSMENMVETIRGMKEGMKKGQKMGLTGRGTMV